MPNLASTAVRRLACLLAALSASALAYGQKMPKRDVIDIPAVGKGLAVHNLFQSNMVLQRDKPIAIWGWAAPGENVSVSFAGDARKATAGPDRSWRVQLPARPASSVPAVMTIQGRTKKLTLDNILVGDVWLLGGQSNMEFPLSRIENGWLEIVSARFDEMRVLTVPAQNGPEIKKGFPRLHEWSGWFGRHYRKGDWDVCSPEIARELSGIGYVFARRIHMATQIPIGIVDVSRGGTTVETWTPSAVLRGIDTPEVKALLDDWDQRVAAWDAKKDLENRVRNFERRVSDRKKRGQAIPANWKAPNDLKPGPAVDQNRPGNCYNSMIAPIAGLAVKGVIFHQGFNNALSAGSASYRMYRRIFPKMIKAWREAFGDAELPFGIISLCTAGQAQTMDQYVERMFDAGIYIREAQYQTFVDLYAKGDKHIGFASSFDHRRAWYHPQVKVPVGERISRWALATQYGLQRDIRWKPPMLVRMETREGELVLYLDQPVAAADPKNPITGFAIAGEDRKFAPATAQWRVKGKDQRGRPQHDRKALVLSSPHVARPIHFRYAWGRNPLGNLQTTHQSHIPFATQRSDAWKIEEVPLGVLGDDKVEGGKLTRGQSRTIQRALRSQDFERRLAEARALLEQHEKSTKHKSRR